MTKHVGLLRRIWRSLLRWYYFKLKEIHADPSKRDRFSRFFFIFPVQRNKILMDNFNGKGYGENPKYIAEELLHSGKKCKIIWLTNVIDNTFPEGVTPVQKHSLRAYYESATAKVWVYNCRFGKLTPKRKNQVLLQAWHGGLALKRVEGDAKEKLSSSYLSAAMEDGQTADGILVDSKPNEELFKRSFWLNPNCELLKIGSPRVDLLFREKDSPEIRRKVRQALGIDESSFFVLYAPTFRKSGSTENYISSFTEILHAFESRYGKTQIAYRLHPNASSLMDTVDWGEACSINATLYPDAQELIIAADCLITDYSSIAYDFALIRKPVFLCVKDIQAYIEEDRGVYDIFYDQPFPLNLSEEALLQEIQNSSPEQICERIDRFYEKYPSYNTGSAAKQTVEWLEKKGLVT